MKKTNHIMKHCIQTSFFIFFIISFHPAFGVEEDCLNTPCNSFTQRQVIRRLWDMPSNKTLLGKKLGEKLSNISRSCKVSNCTLNTILGQTLWIVDIYAGFRHDPSSTSCVFERLLNLTLSETECQNAEHNKALEDYVSLIKGGMEFTKTIGLAAASCTAPFSPPAEPCPEECLSGCSVNAFLEKYGSTIPSYLRSSIKCLNKSSDIRDRTAAIVLSAVLREPLNELFQKVLQTPELLRVMQLKSCFIPISDCCCEIRKGDIRNRLEAVGPVITKFVIELMKK